MYVKPFFIINIYLFWVVLVLANKLEKFCEYINYVLRLSTRIGYFFVFVVLLCFFFQNKIPMKFAFLRFFSFGLIKIRFFVGRCV